MDYDYDYDSPLMPRVSSNVPLGDPTYLLVSGMPLLDEFRPSLPYMDARVVVHLSLALSIVPFAMIHACTEPAAASKSSVGTDVDERNS